MKIHPLIMVLLVLSLLYGCTQERPAQEDQKDAMEPVTGKHVAELERTACNSADKANTCDSKLASLGFITKEECCEKFGKCC